MSEAVSVCGPPEKKVFQPTGLEGLPLSHQRIAQDYVNPDSPAFLNQTKAYKRLRKSVKDSTARVEGHRVLTNPATRSWVREQLSLGGLTKEKIVHNIAALADRASSEGKLDTELASQIALLKARGEWTEKQEVTNLTDSQREAIRRLVVENLNKPN